MGMGMGVGLSPHLHVGPLVEEPHHPLYATENAVCNTGDDLIAVVAHGTHLATQISVASDRNDCF